MSQAENVWEQARNPGRLGASSFSELETEHSQHAGEDRHGTILVKIGGSTLGAHDTTLRDLVAMQRGGALPVVVHGGGRAITEWMERQGVRPTFVRGLRVTDEHNLDIVVAVLAGVINKSIVAAVNAMGGKAVGLSGVDGGMLKAEILDPELGLVGSIAEVDPEPLFAVMDRGLMPVVAPVAVQAGADSAPTDSLLNVNADTAAGAVAVAVAARLLVFMTDVEGVKDSSNRLIHRITERQAEGLMQSNVVAGGMVPKIGACLAALRKVEATHIIDGRRPHSLRDTMDGVPLGTRIG
jgi:acetylglutamate kinase